jgi:catechol 2,3-dioxygenase-like lactoylglutathione lyase family enzyme
MRRLVLILFTCSVLVSASLLAQTTWGQTQTPVPKQAIVDTRGMFFALSVADLDASSRWYSEKLGLEVIFSVPETNGFAVMVLEGGGLTVELVHRDNAVPDPCGATDPTLCHGLFKMGLLVTDLDRTLEKLAARGVPVAFGPFPEQPNQRANAIIRDNAGNLIQLFEK